MTFSREQFEIASARCFQAAHKIDGVIAKSADAKNAWAKLACEGIAAGQLTIEQVQAQLIADYRGQVLKGDEQADFDVSTAKIADCGNTIKGWFYDLKRVVEADQTERVIAGESLTTVRRDTKPRQSQKGKGKSAPKTVPLNEAIAVVRYHVQQAMADNANANALAANSALADMVSDIAKLEAKVNANLQAATAKAA